MKGRVLVVDDQPDVADALVRLISAMGYHAKAEYGGAQAIATAGEFLPDLMFIDLGMPGLDGFQTASQLRAQPPGSRAILIALTGYADPETRQQALQAGFDAHTTKPMGLETLKRALSHIDTQSSLPSNAVLPAPPKVVAPQGDDGR